MIPGTINFPCRVPGRCAGRVLTSCWCWWEERAMRGARKSREISNPGYLRQRGGARRSGGRRARARHSGLSEKQVVDCSLFGSIMVWFWVHPGGSVLWRPAGAAGDARVAPSRAYLDGRIRRHPADSQTGIYPLATPGGWQLVTTPQHYSIQKREEPVLLRSGDRALLRRRRRVC